MAMVGGAIADAFAAAASAASGGDAGVVAAADPRSMSQAELDHMDSLEVENSGEIEMNGIMYAVDYMNDHWKMLTESDDAGTLVLTGSKDEDDRLYKEFRANFGAMDVSMTSITSPPEERTATPVMPPSWNWLADNRTSPADSTVWRDESTDKLLPEVLTEPAPLTFNRELGELTYT
jgi:hypothetical protein